MQNDLLLVVVGVLCIVGAFFILVAAIGLLRLDDLYMRMHAASKAGTLGSGVLLIAIAVQTPETDVALRALAGVVFFLLTAPISAHLLARAAYLVGYKPCAATHADALADANLEGSGAPGQPKADNTVTGATPEKI